MRRLAYGTRAAATVTAWQVMIDQQAAVAGSLERYSSQNCSQPSWNCRRSWLMRLSLMPYFRAEVHGPLAHRHVRDDPAVPLA